ncbi:hypothetical protein EDB83DRAFT_2464763 [Lactarius deliciosus]|nr:hypothetical protein EDB83DRAFT_2464763 [Lactarius deliciosus]
MWGVRKGGRVHKQRAPLPPHCCAAPAPAPLPMRTGVARTNPVGGDIGGCCENGRGPPRTPREWEGGVTRKPGAAQAPPSPFAPPRLRARASARTGGRVAPPPLPGFCATKADARTGGRTEAPPLLPYGRATRAGDPRCQTPVALRLRAGATCVRVPPLRKAEGYRLPPYEGERRVGELTRKTKAKKGMFKRRFNLKPVQGGPDREISAKSTQLVAIALWR